ncbi:uncharacterized protein LOC110675572 [Aedes aegypti]|uniref:Uncharacterized protein n=1 Tax=Aedes aegypti TaxID=7159 RepID=A0A6I8U6S1_AEDAE|nr:uncharacterized protein LOC110675572 [Aedes aegypti]
MMDMQLRTMIKFNGYWMAISWGMVVVWWTSLMLDPEQSHGYVKAHNIRYGGIPAMIFGIIWILTCATLVFGIYKESLFLLCPFASMFLIEFCMVLCRDVYLMSSDHSIDETILFNLSAPNETSMPLLLFAVPNMAFSLLALMQIFRYRRNDNQDTTLIVTTKY